MPDSEAPLELPDPGDANAVLKAFAANSAFRAAEWRELTTEDNPFRRPVRPDDLEWLDYSKPITARNVLKLSGLLGHRMLRNVYDLDLLLLPPQRDEYTDADGGAFYSTRNRALSALAKPVLERHLFTFLADERPAADGTDLAGFRTRVLAEYERRVAEPGAAFGAALSTKNRREAVTFLLLQYAAFAPATRAAAARNALGDYDLATADLRAVLLDDYADWVRDAGRYTEVLASAELKPAPAAYWQLSLNTSLGRGNHLHHLAVNHEKLFAFLGAFLHQKLDDAVTARHYADVVEDGFSARPAYFDQLRTRSAAELGELVDTLIGPLVARFGDAVVAGAQEGFADAAHFARLWDSDLTAQITWADRIPDYQALAEKIQTHIDDEGLEIPLDTFVESSEETSTTHVHDEHRLVVIEAGQMHFWNNVTHKIELNTGDKVLIPLSRLHGSTVLSGECTYHQPIIPEEMYRQFA
jgi:hypothetical protein